MLSKIKNYITNNTGILIRLDDIAENMNWDLMKKIELLFEEYSIKPILGVIPENKDSELLSHPKKNDFWEQVRNWRDKGWEITMHGYNHVYDKFSKNGDYFNYGGGSEFCGHSLETQILRIRNGLEKFKAEKIKMAEVIEAIEGKMEPKGCHHKDGSCTGISGKCLNHDLWDELGRQIELFLGHISLKDIVEGNVLGRSRAPLSALD